MIYFGATVGSLAGGYIPGLWGAGIFSGWSFLLGTLGGLLGVYLAYQLTA
jgi:hypothetical protein